MKRILFLSLLILIPIFLFPEDLQYGREIDLSFFLRPNEPPRIMAASDSSGNIFITR
ncbi:MAG: hypothetical protein ACUVUG_04320 [Candidatus Aminicenantia bacterium]